MPRSVRPGTSGHSRAPFTGSSQPRRTVVRVSSGVRRVGVVLGLVMLAGCGSGSEPPKVASASKRPPTSAPPAAAGELAQYLAAQRAWVACVRAHGIAASDPDPLG